MDGDLPTGEDFFGAPATPQSNELPSGEDFFAPTLGDRLKSGVAHAVQPYAITAKAALAEPGYLAKQAGAALGVNEPPPSGPEYDDFFHKTTFGRVLDHFGQGLKDGWGDGPMTLSEDSEKWLRDVGIYNDYKSGQQSLIKSYNEAFLRPAVTGLTTIGEAGWRGMSAAFAGAQAVLHEGGEAVGQLLPQKGIEGVIGPGSRFAADVAASPEAFPNAHFFGVPTTIAKARALGVIGEGEAGWKGTLPAEDPKVAQRRYVDAYRDWEDERAAAPTSAEGTAPPGEAGPSAPGAGETPAAQPVPDIHQTARQIAPEVMSHYDALQTRQDTFRRWIDEFRDERDTKATADLDKQIEDIQGRLEGATGKRAATYRDRLEDLQTQRETALTDARKADSPEMTKIRGDLQKVDYQLRDLAPDVSAAYRRAQEVMPEGGNVPRETSAVEGPAAPETRAPLSAEGQSQISDQTGKSDLLTRAETAPPEAVAPSQPTLESGSSTPKPDLSTQAPGIVKPVPEQMAAIASDVSGRLVAAGRPKAEADAAAQLMAARYATRAARFNGAKGTAEELYNAEGADIRAGRERAGAPVKELVQKDRVRELKQSSAMPSFSLDMTDAEIDRALPRATDQVAGLKIRDDVPNLSSISASIPNGETLPGIREIPFSWFEEKVNPDAVGARIKELAKEISTNKEINPLIVAFDSKGPYIIEGGHRYDALQIIGADSFPAKVVLDLDELPDIRAKELEQPARGKVRFDQDGSALITLMKNADASTFVHESGHVFLEEMMRDARDEKAPQVLRDDMQTVRDWLGAKEDAAITTRQHEKFARGFERYLMEGTAPSKELASVFRQFKEWLVQIYKSVSALKSEITPEIRQVFDRLLAENPEHEPIIAADRERAEHFADLHTREAEDTLPEHAAQTADRMRAESDEIARLFVPDIHAELNHNADLGHEPGAEAGRNTGAGAEPASGGDATGPTAGENGSPAAPGGVGAGGGETAAQGAGARTVAKTEIPAGATNRFDTPASPLIDKAGNIVVKNLNQPEDVLKAIRDAAAENSEFQAARRGVVSDAHVLDLAQAAGVDPVLIHNQWQVGKAFNAEDVTRTRLALIQSATDVRDAAIKAANGTDADLLAYAETKSRHAMIQEVVSGITAEAGRALRAFRTIKGMAQAEEIGTMLETSQGKTLYQLRREANFISKLDTPQKVSKAVKDSNRASYGQMLVEYYINALLSGPITHLRNIGQNMGTLLNTVGERQIAGGLGATREALGGEQSVKMGEAKAQLYGLMKAAPESVVAAWKTFKNEEFLESAKTSEQRKFQAIPSAVIETGRNEPGSAAFKAKVEGMAINQARLEGLKGDALDKRAREIMAAPTPEMLAGAEKRTFEVGGRQLRTFTRALGAADEFFKGMATRAELEALAWRTASNEGLEGNAFYNRLTQLVENPTEEMMETANKAAAYNTFQNPMGKFGIGATMIANSSPAARMVVTFVRTPINVAKYSIERTPLGAISREVRDNLMGKNGAVAADTQRARLIMGTTIGVATIGLVGQGLITDGGPTDPNERASKIRGGWQPYSVNIGGHWVPLQWFPTGILMGLYADTVRMWDHLTAGEAERIPALLGASISKNLTNQTFLQGPANLIEAIQDPDRYGDKYAQNMAASVLVPTGVNWITRTEDPYLREVHGFLEAVKARIPGLSNDLMPKRDVWGEPLLRDQPITTDPIEQRLQAIQYFPAKLDNKIRGVELTPEQYDDYARVAGRSARMRVEAVAANPALAQAPAGVQRDVYKEAVEGARDAAQSLILMQNQAEAARTGAKSILQLAVEDKVAPLTSDVPKRHGPIKQEAVP